MLKETNELLEDHVVFMILYGCSGPNCPWHTEERRRGIIKLASGAAEWRRQKDGYWRLYREDYADANAARV